MRTLLQPGAAAPWFTAAALNGRQDFGFSSVGGRWVVLLVLGSAASAGAAEALRLVQSHRSVFDDETAMFFGVTVDPSDVAEERIARDLPGIRWFLDYNGSVSRLYGAARESLSDYAPHWLLIDPMLRVRARCGLDQGEELIAQLREHIRASWQPPAAPVLVVPEVLSPELCRQLVDLYNRHGGRDSGFMKEENGVTVEQRDYSHKRRADHLIQDDALVAELKVRVDRALVPMIHRAFQFRVTRIERFLVACYDAQDGGHFRAHRDNTTKGTAHRRFACTINLNPGDYEGGDLSFPEFGTRTYRAPLGGAVVFSCSLLHEARPVTKGRRYAFLPFLYDEEAALLREKNLAHVAPNLQNYRSGLVAAE